MIVGSRGLRAACPGRCVQARAKHGTFLGHDELDTESTARVVDLNRSSHSVKEWHEGITDQASGVPARTLRRCGPCK